MKAECDAVFLFIAELNGSFTPGSGTEVDKIRCGQEDYVNSRYHTLDLDNDEDRKDLHENMWLERLYSELDRYFDIPLGFKGDRPSALNSRRYRAHSYKWTVPIELDASALTNV